MVENEGAGLDGDCRKDSLDQRYIAVLGRPEPGLGVSVVSSPPSICAYRNRFPPTISSRRTRSTGREQLANEMRRVGLIVRAPHVICADRLPVSLRSYRSSPNPDCVYPTPPTSPTSRTSPDAFRATGRPSTERQPAAATVVTTAASATGGSSTERPTMHHLVITSYTSYTSDAGQRKRRRRLGSALAAATAIGSLVIAAHPRLASATTCTKTWTGAAGVLDGTFNEAAKWTPAGIPATTDDVCITEPGTYVVDYEQQPGFLPKLHAISVGGSAGVQTLRLQAGKELTLEAPSTINRNGAILLSGPGATLDTPYVAGAALASVSNHGHIAIDSVGGTAYIELPLANETDALFDVTGQLQYDLGAFDNRGSVTVRAGASMNLVRRFGFAVSFSNLAGSLNVLGDFAITDGTFTQGDGVTTGKGPVVQGTLVEAAVGAGGGGPITFTGGDIRGTIPSLQTLTLPAGRSYISTTVVNNGRVVLDSGGGDIGLISGAYLSQPTGLLENHGTIETRGTGLAEITVPITNFAAGVIDIKEGRALQDGSSLDVIDNQGSFIVESGAGFLVSTFSTFVNSGTLTVNGDGPAAPNKALGAFVVQRSTFRQRGAVAGTGVTSTQDSTLDHTAGGGTGLFTVRRSCCGPYTQLTGSLPSGETITLDSSAVPGVGAGIPDGAELKIDTPVTNNGTLVLRDLTGDPASLFTYNGAGTLTNNGTIRADGAGAGKRFRLPLTNAAAGTIDVVAGTLVQDLGTTTTNDGTFVIGPGGAYQLNNGRNTMFAQGSTGSLHLTVTANPPPGQVTSITGDANPGSANLAGELAVSTIGTPAVGTRYHAIANVHTTGTFSSYAFGATPYDVDYLASGLGVDLVAVAPLSVTTTSLPNGNPGAVYPGATLASSGGTGAVTWTVGPGSLPPGLALDPTSGAISGTPTTAGTSSFTVVATDSGHPAQHASANLSIAVIALVTPDTSISSGPANGSVSPVSSPSFTFVAAPSAPGTTFQCSTDGAAFTACTSPTMLTALADGSHTFAVRAVGAGGADPTPASRTWKVDTIAPTISITSPANGAVFVVGPVVIPTFSCSDANPLTCSATGQSVDTSSPSAARTFTVTAIDQAGNTRVVTSTYSVVAAPPVAGDLALKFDDSDDNFKTGRDEWITVIVRNRAKAPTSGTVTVSDALPVGLQFVEGRGPGWSCTAASQLVTCTHSTPIPKKTKTRVNIKVRVLASRDALLTNTATVTPFDAIPANNTDTQRIKVRAANAGSEHDHGGDYCDRDEPDDD